MVRPSAQFVDRSFFCGVTGIHTNKLCTYSVVQMLDEFSLRLLLAQWLFIHLIDISS